MIIDLKTKQIKEDSPILTIGNLLQLLSTISQEYYNLPVILGENVGATNVKGTTEGLLIE